MPRSEAIPFVDLAARHAEAAADVEDAVLDVLRSGRWIGGPAVERAEAVAARWLGKAGAVGVASGTDALILALQALGIGAGDEVVVPALTFFATAGAVLAAGAEVVLADVGPDALLDPTSAAAAIGPRTKVILPVHLFGSACELPDLGRLVLDDAAQSIGTAPSPRGVLAALSTYPTKTWGSAGDGGFVAGDDPDLLARVRRLGHHGFEPPATYDRVSGHVGRASRLDAVQAAVLLGHAPQLEPRIARRRRLAARFDAGLPASLTPLPRSAGSSVQQYNVLVAGGSAPRAALQAALRERGVGTAVYYPRALSAQPALAGCRRVPTPRAETLADEILALPIHDVDDGEVDQILSILAEVA